MTPANLGGGSSRRVVMRFMRVNELHRAIVWGEGPIRFGGTMINAAPLAERRLSFDYFDACCRSSGRSMSLWTLLTPSMGLFSGV